MPTFLVSKILAELEKHAPQGTAESWDNVGLLVGDTDWKTSGAVVSIDLTPEAIKLALNRKFRLIVNHHPCIFPSSRGLARVVKSPGTQGLVFEALRNGIAVIASHTNFDQCALEVVKQVSGGLGIEPLGRLNPHEEESLTKLVVFVPSAHVQLVRDAVCTAGAGQIGNYDFCTFGTEGEGTFRGGRGTEPFVGKPGVLEKAREIRLETIFPKGLEKPVLRALREAHPYEEIAYDLYPVSQRPPAKGIVSGLGYGFWGQYSRPVPFSEVLGNVRRNFNSNGFLFTDSTPGRSRSRRIRKVAFAAGNGASFVQAAVSLGCELFITGEAGYHTALDASRKGMAVLELGHRESELFFLKTMKSWLVESGLGVATLDVPTQRFMF